MNGDVTSKVASSGGNIGRGNNFSDTLIGSRSSSISDGKSNGGNHDSMVHLTGNRNAWQCGTNGTDEVFTGTDIERYDRANKSLHRQYIPNIYEYFMHSENMSSLNSCLDIRGRPEAFIAGF